MINAKAGISVSCGASSKKEESRGDNSEAVHEQIKEVYTIQYQSKVENRLEEAKSLGNYTEESMLIEPNPYGTNTLSLYVYFQTEEPAQVSYTVASETEKIPDFTVLPSSEERNGTDHEFQVIGLVPNMENTVTFTIAYEDGTEKTYNYTDDTGDILGEEETTLAMEDLTENASDQLENGLYVIL